MDFHYITSFLNTCDSSCADYLDRGCDSSLLFVYIRIIFKRLFLILKIKVNPITGREGPEGEYLALDGHGWLSSRPSPRERDTVPLLYFYYRKLNNPCQHVPYTTGYPLFRYWLGIEASFHFLCFYTPYSRIFLLFLRLRSVGGMTLIWENSSTLR